MTFIQGFVAAVPTANRDAYRDHAAQALPLFKEFGARRMVEAWGDDVPDGTVTDFRGAVQAKDGETVVFETSADGETEKSLMAEYAKAHPKK